MLNDENFPCAPSCKSGWPWTEESESLPPLMPNDKSWPKISIVTPSYNQGQYIEETIRSVLLQNYPNIEYIIIDGGSTDSSVEIIKKYEQWLTYWVSEPDKGQSDAINKGIGRCTGDIFNWLCSDDYLEKDSLADIATNLEEESINVYCGVSRLLHCDDSVSYASTPICDSVEKTISIGHICQPSTYFKFNIIKNLGYLNITLHYCMDAELWIKYLLTYGAKNIVDTERILVNYRYHETSKSVSQAQLFDDDLNAIRYSVMKCFKAPECLIKYYEPSNIHSINILPDIKLVHKSINIKKLLLCYTKKSISNSLHGLKLADLVLILIYDVYLNLLGLFSGWVYRFTKRKE